MGLLPSEEAPVVGLEHLRNPRDFVEVVDRRAWALP